MALGGSSESVGENREFNVADASDVTIFFTGGNDTDNPKTSLDDTETEKYTDNSGSVKRYQLRCDNAIQVVSINGIAFSEPISVAADNSITERFDQSVIFKMVIRLPSADSNVKLRVH